MAAGTGWNAQLPLWLMAILHFAGVELLPTICFECINYAGGKYYSLCPKDGMVQMGRAYYAKCEGACFTKGDSTNSSVVVRGCTASQGTLPHPLPPDGCYTWNGAPFCVCSTPLCNNIPLGTSSGVSLDAHLLMIDDFGSENGSHYVEEGPLQCFQCLAYGTDDTYYPQCPKDAMVHTQTVFLGDCNGTCFTRSFKDNPENVGRGCTTTQYGLPYPLPPNGCYDNYGDVWCICNRSRCNGRPMGKSSGVDFDEHLYAIEDVIEEDGINRCYQCVNFDLEGNYYPQCAKDHRVRNAYVGPCNGSCYTRSYDYNHDMVARGCTDTQWGLPDPLPPDGCYRWYSEVWCVCSTSRCNGKAIGAPSNIEFDEHVKHQQENHGSRPAGLTFLWICIFRLVLLFIGGLIA